MSRYKGPKPGSGKAHQPSRTNVDRTPVDGSNDDSRCACRGTGRLSTFTIDGEIPEQFVSCPWCLQGGPRA